MPWNWRKPDWPNFSWDAARLRPAEARFLIGSGLAAGLLKHLPGPDRDHLLVHGMTTDAVTTSRIEGEILDRASVQSSVRRQLGLQTDPRRVPPSEEGVAEVMVDLYRCYLEPLSEKKLFSWHASLLKGRADLNDLGAYRTGDAPTEIVSGALHAPKDHFEAPPAGRVPEEMRRFVEWFNRTAPDAETPLPPLTRAGVAHLWFESIHPFEDGNGRIGRALSEKALAQGLGQAPLTGLAAAILIRRKEYYAALEAASRRNEITDWLSWFAEIALDGQRRTAAAIEFLIEKTRLLDRLRGQLNARQEKALLRMLAEGPDGFLGGLSAGNYSSITGAATATTTRDLADLVEKGALRRTGERRHARYFLAIPTPPVPESAAP
jgi:Fic family protein